MSTLEVIQSFPSQCNALLVSTGSLDSTGLVANFDLYDAKPCFPYHVALHV